MPGIDGTTSWRLYFCQALVSYSFLYLFSMKVSYKVILGVLFGYIKGYRRAEVEGRSTIFLLSLIDQTTNRDSFIIISCFLQSTIFHPQPLFFISYTRRQIVI